MSAGTIINPPPPLRRFNHSGASGDRRTIRNLRQQNADQVALGIDPSLGVESAPDSQSGSPPGGERTYKIAK
jgi:hypothetical protein